MAEALTVRRGERKGEQYADLRPETRQRLDLLGMERALTNWCRLVFPFQDWIFCPWRGSGRLLCSGPCNSRAGRRRMYYPGKKVSHPWHDPTHSEGYEALPSLAQSGSYELLRCQGKCR